MLVLSFAGHSSKECEEFIIKVTKAAYHECFLRDDERVAALAAAGLEGKALRWYEALPITSAARTDWQLLRQYMLDEWSAGSESEGEVSDTTLFFPVPMLTDTPRTLRLRTAPLSR